MRRTLLAVATVLTVCLAATAPAGADGLDQGCHVREGTAWSVQTGAGLGSNCDQIALAGTQRVAVHTTAGDCYGKDGSAGSTGWALLVTGSCRSIVASPNRIGITATQDRCLWKENSLGAAWSQLPTGAGCLSMAITDTRIAARTTNNDCYVWTPDRQDNVAGGGLCTQVALADNRVGTRLTNGVCRANEGGVTAPIVVLIDANCEQIALSSTVVAVRMRDGRCLAKPGLFDSFGVLVDTGCADIAVSGDRIAIRMTDGRCITKDVLYGAFTFHVDANCTGVALSSNRVGVGALTCSATAFTDSFEQTPIPPTSTGCWRETLDNDGTMARTTTRAQSGSASVELGLGADGEREELICYDSTKGCAGGQGSEFVYEFSFMVPSDVTLPARSTNIMQTKPSDFPTPSCYGGGLQIEQDPASSDRVRVSLQTRWGAITSSGEFCDTTGKKSDVFPEPYAKDTWHRLKLHARWNNSSDPNQGFIAAWLDDAVVVPKRNQRNLLDGAGREQTFRIGPYETQTRSPWRIYYDNVVVRRVG